MPASSDIVERSDIIPGSASSWKFVQSGAANETAGYNHCLRCNRKIKAPQTMGRVCLRKTKLTDARNDSVDGQLSLKAEKLSWWKLRAVLWGQ